MYNITMKKLSRVIQFVSCKANHMIYKEPKLINKENGIFELVNILNTNHYKNICIMTTNGFIRRKTLVPFFEALKKNQINYHIFCDVTPDPTIECVEKARDYYMQNNCECMIAIGGGSVIDCAKIALARVVSNKTIPEMKGILKIHTKLPALYAVPTTAGTGSEATAAAVVTDFRNGTHYKYAVSDFCLIPSVAILDPVLSLSLPSNMSAYTGMDALTHALEAYTNKYASNTVKNYALDAIVKIYKYLPLVYKDGSNTQYREEMLVASYEAGIAFTTNFVGYVHAIAHAIGGIYGVPHGLANAIILPVVLEEYGDSIKPQLDTINKLLHIDNFINVIYQMNEDMNIPKTFHCLNEKDFDEIIDRAIHEGNPTYPVPVIWNKEVFRKVLYRLKG